jgi:tetratricopeptide (TPR) repeat protein
MADVFISYARSTEGCARALADLIERDGHSVWYDARLPAHRPFADVIEQQIDAAKAVLIIWSKEAVGSQWVRSEADRGRVNGTLIQMRIDDCILPMPFDQIHCPLVGRWDREVRELAPVLTSLTELLDGKPPAKGATKSPTGSRRKRARLAEAQLLFDSAMKALQSGQPELHAQAIPLLVEATSIDPNDSEAWGLLAVLYAARRMEVAPDERAAMVARAKSAIRTASSLDPRDLRARCAEVILVTPYRNWQCKEEGAREILRDEPGQPLALFSLATVLANVGRWREAVEAATSISRTRFLLPVVEQFTVNALWSAGDILKAEQEGDRAARRFPRHSGLWEARLELLMQSGRAHDAVSMIDDERAHPADCSADKLGVARATALALHGASEVADAVKLNLEGARRQIVRPLLAAQRCAALGALDDCFAILEGYYFGEGPGSGLAPRGGDEDRETYSLFMPPMSGLWKHERFHALTAAVGLDAYWSTIGRSPDYRTS